MILIIGGKYQGKHEYAKQDFPGKNIVEFSDILSGKIKENECTDALIIAEENSSGIVPSDIKELRYREEYNRTLTGLASRADEVYRVFCGIGMKIK